MEFKPVKVALIGSGNISYIYLNTLKNGGFKIIDMVGCSDLFPEKSKARAETFGIRQMSNEEILGDPEIEIVLNTTQLWNHTEVTKMILNAGKHVYSEKTMGSDYVGAKMNYDLAKSKGLRIGCAPDCYMGAAAQTARKLIDDGMIGVPLFANAFCFRGYGAHLRPSEPEDNAVGWTSKGSTITYDMAGYYTNSLINLLGPVKRVSGYTRCFTDRDYVNQDHPNYRQRLKELPGTTISMCCFEFVSGCYASFTLCSEGFGPEIPRVEVYGTEGTMSVPDPNNFGGLDDQYVYLTRIGNDEKFKMPFSHGFRDTDPYKPTLTGKIEPCHNSWRGIAVADMAWAIRRGRQHRSSAELALHTVEICDAIDTCQADGKVREMESRPDRPAPLRAGYTDRAAEASIDNI